MCVLASFCKLLLPIHGVCCSPTVTPEEDSTETC